MPIPLLSGLLAFGAGNLIGSALRGRRRQGEDIQTISTLTPEQRLIAASLADLIGENLGRPAQAFGGPLVAPLSGLEQQAMGAVSRLLQQDVLTGNLPALPQPTTPQAPGALSRILDAQPAFSVNPQETQALFEQAVAAPALRQFQRDILPATREAFVGPGTFWSSMRAQAEARAGQDLATQLAAQRAQLALADVEAQRQAAESAAQRAAGVLPAALSFALQSSALPFEQGLQARQQAFRESLGSRGAALETAQLGALLGQQARGVEQQALQSAYQEFLRTRPEASPWLNAALAFLGEPMMAAFQLPFQPSPFSQLLGLVGQLGAGWLAGGAPSLSRILSLLG